MRPISQSKPQRQRCINLYIKTCSTDGDQPNPGKNCCHRWRGLLPKQTTQDRWCRAPLALPWGQAMAEPAALRQRKLSAGAPRPELVCWTWFRLLDMSIAQCSLEAFTGYPNPTWCNTWCHTSSENVFVFKGAWTSFSGSILPLF